jgi:hypothetical protein
LITDSECVPDLDAMLDAGTGGEEPALWYPPITEAIQRLDTERESIPDFFVRPTEEEFAKNRSRALWMFALNAVGHLLETRSVRWTYIRKRRDLRIRYLESEKKSRVDGILTPTDISERNELIRTIHPDDRKRWNAVMEFRERREVIHT